MIDVAGGDVAVDGILLQVPPGALTAPAEIRLKRRAGLTGVPESVRVLGTGLAVQLEPAGLEFELPVRLMVDAALLPAGVLPSEVEMLWEHQGVYQLPEVVFDAAANKLVIELDHFSAGEVVRRPSATTVDDVVSSELYALTCSTSRLLKLSRQVVDAVNVLRPGALVGLNSAKLRYAEQAAALPFLLGEAAFHLNNVLATLPSPLLVKVNSAWRSPAQQYAVYHWQGLSGLSANCPERAADVGLSNHEGGRGLDVAGTIKPGSSAAADWIAAFTTPDVQGRKFTWLGATTGDKPHFDYVPGPIMNVIDLRPVTVLAFQTLWNLNMPCDPIPDAELSKIPVGPKTFEALGRAPAGGFERTAGAIPFTLIGLKDAGCNEQKAVCCDKNSEHKEPWCSTKEGDTPCGCDGPDGRCGCTYSAAVAGPLGISSLPCTARSQCGFDDSLYEVLNCTGTSAYCCRRQ
jgi:hypothetical protein